MASVFITPRLDSAILSFRYLTLHFCHPSARGPQDPGNYAHTFSCHCEPSQMAWQSLLYRCVPQCVARALMRPVRILVFVQTALALVFTYSLFPRLTPAGILVFVQTALSLVFTYSDSLRAIADGAAIQ